jgi:alpha-galactosidase
LRADDGWVTGRFPNGSIIPDAKVFPLGVKATADYLHSIGMKLGLYTSRGQTTCLRRMGSQDYEKIDMQQYADWGVDCAARI